MFNPFSGTPGPDGNGIVSIVFVSSTGGDTPGIEGAADTYQINYTDAPSTTYIVTNGSKGSQGPVGQTGAQGVPGPVGPAGPEGPAGPAGPEGPAGPVGQTGAQGVPGPVGPAGPEGPAGPAGPEGPGTPVGCIFPFAGTNLPAGYLLCNGASYKVVDYPNLYAAIGNKYGGDTANFNVPNLVDKFIQGSTTSGTNKAAGLPNITGAATYFSEGCVWSGEANGAFNRYAPNQSIQIKNVALSGDTHYGYYFSFDASRSNAIYGNSNTVQPPALTMIYIIKAK